MTIAVAIIEVGAVLKGGLLIEQFVQQTLKFFK